MFTVFFPSVRFKRPCVVRTPKKNPSVMGWGLWWWWWAIRDRKRKINNIRSPLFVLIISSNYNVLLNRRGSKYSANWGHRQSLFYVYIYIYIRDSFCYNSGNRFFLLKIFSFSSFRRHPLRVKNRGAISCVRKYQKKNGPTIPKRYFGFDGISLISPLSKHVVEHVPGAISRRYHVSSTRAREMTGFH